MSVLYFTACRMSLPLQFITCPRVREFHQFFIVNKGRDLWVMVVSISPFQHMKGKPDIKYVANIHGNEVVGREMSLHLIEVCSVNIYLLNAASKESIIKSLN